MPDLSDSKTHAQATNAIPPLSTHTFQAGVYPLQLLKNQQIPEFLPCVRKSETYKQMTVLEPQKIKLSKQLRGN